MPHLGKGCRELCVTAAFPQESWGGVKERYVSRDQELAGEPVREFPVFLAFGVPDEPAHRRD